jgi:membrane protease YdiL (CAAX protease family)
MGCFGAVLVGFGHALGAYLVVQSLNVGTQVTLEAAGKLAVSPPCLEALANREESATNRQQLVAGACWLKEGDREAQQQYRREISERFVRDGVAGFVPTRSQWGFARSPRGLPALPAVMASLVLGLWFFVLVSQGEGVDIDPNRRRHPMWEWLLSHPVEPGAVFFAEMVSAAWSNPVMLLAPVFWAGVYFAAYDDFWVACGAGLVVGAALALAASCLSKALEISVMLRLAPRSRGAVLGLLATASRATIYLAYMPLVAPRVVVGAARLLRPLATDAGGLLLYGAAGAWGTPSPWKGVLACCLFAAAAMALSVWWSASGTRQGLAGGFGPALQHLPVRGQGVSRWGLADPAIRKELLWLRRDRSALLQVFLIPLTIAGPQIFNLGRAWPGVTGWNLMSAAVILVGSGFLTVLGPRSFVSEGQALWISLTWPRGLEDLLQAKARIWRWASWVVVLPALLATAFLFPAEAHKVALVALGWVVFSSSLAEKTVTLVRVPSTSGELEPIPLGRAWAASIGTFTYAAGVVSQRWSLALMGIVYSALTSAAMWQNLRARLPYLFDPWSEPAPKAPTLLHALVAISSMTDLMATIFAFVVVAVGMGGVEARAIAYGIAGAVTWFVASKWLRSRGVSSREVWTWEPRAKGARVASRLALGVCLGVFLGLLGHSYESLVTHLGFGQGFRAFGERLSSHPDERWWMAVMACGFAPLAEEYLYRGLLFRALDREWGGWKSVWGSACFFAIYHPPMAWVPVAIVGATSAWLFRRSRILAPSVLLHMAYNAVIVWQ